MSDLKNTIQNHMKEAMRAKDSVRLGTIRMLLAAIKQREIDDQITLSDTEILKIINKQIKQHHDSISQFRAAGREALAEKEEQELKVLQSYLPEPISEGELKELIQQAINETGAQSIKDLGKVMGILKPKIEGKTDLSLVSERIKSLLQTSS